MSSTTPQGVLPVVIGSNNPQCEPDVYVVGAIQCEALGLPAVAVLLDAKRNQLALLNECGCSVGASISQLLFDLAVHVRAQHGTGGVATH